MAVRGVGRVQATGNLALELAEPSTSQRVRLLAAVGCDISIGIDRDGQVDLALALLQRARDVREAASSS